MKLLVCDREEALSIGKDKFIDNGVLYLVYVEESDDNALKDVKYFLSGKDFNIINIEDLKETEKEKKYVVNLENRYVNQRKLGQLQENYPNVRFTGSGLMNLDCLKLGVLPKEELESRLSCRIKDKKPFVYNEILEIAPFVEGLSITCQCLRVPVLNGHTASVFIKFKNHPCKDELIEKLIEFKGFPQRENLPSAPKQFIHYMREDDRPQVKLDVDCENGMAISVGRLREDSVYDFKFIGLAHNTLRGAAGGAVLCAETLVAKGYITNKDR